MKIAVIGLGKLGSPLLAVAAQAGHYVVGFDVASTTVASIAGGHAPVEEPDLQRLLNDCGERIAATGDVREAVSNVELIFVVVPTPSLPSGAFSCREVIQAMQAIGPHLSEAYQVVALVSTVLPGQCEAEVIPALEAASNKRCGEDFGFCYNPTFIALGSVIRDLTCPDLVLIGASDVQAGEREVVENFHRSICETDAAIQRMRIINAEIAKLALNTFITTKISYANMLSQLCERLPGADAAVVCQAIGCDRRVGHRYLRPATAYGGPCFPRDNQALLHVANRVGVSLPLATATDAINAVQTARLCELVMNIRKPGQCVGILGLAYKPGTPVCECSPGLDLTEGLLRYAAMVLWDELALPTVQLRLGDAVKYAPSMATCCRAADILVVMLPDPAFRQLPPPELAGKTVIDPWGIVENVRDFYPGTQYVRLGVGLTKEH